MNKIFATAFFLMLSLTADFEIKFSELPVLPDTGEKKQIGYAGSFAGYHNETLIIAGGANFPDGFPWVKKNGIGPDKIYHSSIITYRKDSSGHLESVWLPSVRMFCKRRPANCHRGEIRAS